MQGAAAASLLIPAVGIDLARDRADALLVAPDSFFAGRRVQFATTAARYGIPTAYFNRVFVEVGGLMSYGTDVAESFRPGRCLCRPPSQAAKASDLPVAESTKFELAINLHTAELLGLDVPPSLLAIADEVIE